jgi:hypothetical protein
MKQTIVIAAGPNREKWISQCVKSLGDLPYIVVSTDGYELGKIRWVYENTNLDRWFLIHDSVLIKDTSLFDLAFSYPKSVAVSNCPTKFGMYLGIYQRETLSKVGIPHANSKEDAIRYEIEWSNKYCEEEGDVPTLFPDFVDHNHNGIKDVFGRRNLVLENKYLIKYKGTWGSFT